MILTATCLFSQPQQNQLYILAGICEMASVYRTFLTGKTYVTLQACMHLL